MSDILHGPTTYKWVRDLVSLSELSAVSLLETLRFGYQDDEIYVRPGGWFLRRVLCVSAASFSLVLRCVVSLLSAVPAHSVFSSPGVAGISGWALAESRRARRGKASAHHLQRARLRNTHCARLSTVAHVLVARRRRTQTNVGPVLVSVNPFKRLPALVDERCRAKYQQYSTRLDKLKPVSRLRTDCFSRRSALLSSRRLGDIARICDGAARLLVSGCRWRVAVDPGVRRIGRWQGEWRRTPLHAVAHRRPPLRSARLNRRRDRALPLHRLKSARV